MATKRRTLLLFSSCLKMSIFYGGLAFAALYYDICTHQTNVSGEGCNPEDYEKKFQKVLVWEMATFVLYFISLVIGGGNILYVRLREAAEQGLAVDENVGIKISKPDVVAVFLTMLAYITFIVAGFQMAEFRTARLHCM